MSSPPTPYTRNFDFNSFQTANPASPLPGLQVDGELNEIKATTDQIISRLSEVQRDDGAVANDTIGFDQLKQEVIDHINTFGAGANVDAANAAASAAEAAASALAADNSADEALAHKNQAQSAQAAAEAARDLAATYRADAQTAAASATADASTANTHKNTAQAAAITAGNHANDASIYATNAAASANAAGTHSASAGASAAAAGSSATAAAASAAAAAASETAAAASAASVAGDAAAAAAAAATATAKAAEASDTAAYVDGRADDAFTYANAAEASKNAAAASAATAATDAASADADAATASAAASGAQARWDDFRGRYFGALASAPGVDPVHGGAIDAGDFFYNTTAGQWQVWTGSSWATMGSVTTGVSSFNSRTGAVAPTAGDYTATQITNTPAGSIAATNVQGAINELDGDITALASIVAGKANASHTHAIADVTGLQTALDGKQPLDTQLTALAALSPAADQVPYFTSASAAALMTVTSTARSLLDDTSVANMRTTLGLGTAATQASTAFQAADATLTALAGLTTVADRMIYATGADTFALTTLTAFARSILDDADAAAVRTTLGLGSAATQESSAFAAASHSHVIADVTGLQTALDGKAAASHSHAISDVTGLQTALDNKLDDSEVGTGPNQLVRLDGSSRLPAIDGSQLTGISSGSGRLIGFQVFTAGGTYNKNTSANYIIVEVLGGGGGAGNGKGGASVHGSGQPGGGGGYALKKINNVDVGATETVTVGAGGNGAAGGNGTAAADGSDGGTTSFGAHVSATGGKGGRGTSAGVVTSDSVTEGGDGVGGDINIRGQAPTCHQLYAASARMAAPGGNGGGRIGGAGARAVALSASPSTHVSGNNAAANTGGGGSPGVTSYNSATYTAAGGNGGSGLVIVWEYA
jgi:hypothetical protein